MSEHILTSDLQRNKKSNDINDCYRIKKMHKRFVCTPPSYSPKANTIVLCSSCNKTLRNCLYLVVELNCNKSIKARVCSSCVFPELILL